jgi:hypothetical protein
VIKKKHMRAILIITHDGFAFGRQQSCLPKTLKALLDAPSLNFIENDSYNTFDDQNEHN